MHKAKNNKTSIFTVYNGNLHSIHKMNDSNNKPDAPWKKNTDSLLVVYTILAAIAGVFLAYLLTEEYTKEYPRCLLFTIPLFFSIILFISSAERVTDALDEDDVRKLVYNYLLYNLAAILLVFGTMIGMYLKFFGGDSFQCNIDGVLTLVGFLLIFFFCTWKWWSDIHFLFLASKEEFRDYILELEGKTEPEPDWGFFMRMFYRIRKYLRGEIEEFIFPQNNIILRNSPIDGIGVFALKKINKDEIIAEGIHPEDSESIIKWSEVENLEPKVKKMIMDFCIGTPEGFYSPEGFDFNTLTTEWYMNHSCDGNVGFNGAGDFIAIKNIAEGDELTYDYALAESNPDFKMECNCKNSNCRKVITGNDWKNPIITKNIINYMSPILKNKITYP